MRDDRSDRPTPRAGRPEILLASERLGFLRPALEPRYRVHSRPDGDETAAYAPLRGVQAIVSGGAHDPAPLLARLPGVGLVQLIGAGYEGVDLAAAKARGVQVANTPSVNAADVADLALALFLHLACRLGEADGRVRSGDWRRSGAGPVRRSLRDLRVGVVGMGAIGQAIAARVAAFGCALRWWGPSDKPGLAWPRVAKLEALAAGSDVLFVAARGDERNRGLVGATLLDALPAGAFLINVARGSLLDEPALIARLRDGRLGGAGLDVFQQEPTDPELWAGVPNTVLTPHLGGYASAAMRAMIDLAVSNLDRYFAGQPLAAVSRLA